ncbi:MULTISPECIES: hypothetical protein [unclassified Micromonospora]|uniref:hypothetical protein n=1 Tax=unclassified Micromonospora TaxID=2617518 RepID=UPI0022B692A8|nr:MULTISPECIES: hypothetical protein [unclassified Micromonospora]MCZ7421651.1 hypothetical protein [Verrucosispora sp. WMMA2121]WBB93670.1 hypothetical protein O7597_12195 [Verrucosispora sp. WMMC514]
MFREVSDLHPPHGWTWVDCYQLDQNGDATDRRRLFVRPAGLRRVHSQPTPYAQRTRPSAKAAR